MSNHSLLASWWQSLSLLRWSNLKLFLLVSFKAIRDNWKLLLAGALLYVAIIFIIDHYFFPLDSMEELTHPYYALKQKFLFPFMILIMPFFGTDFGLVLLELFKGLAIAFTCFILRPSVDNKHSYAYHQKFIQWTNFFSLILIIFFWGLIFAFCVAIFLFVCSSLFTINTKYQQ